MSTTVPAGLGVTLGVVDNSGSNYGVEAAPTRWLLPHPNESLTRKKTVWQSKALHGSTTLLGQRRVNILNEAAGKFTIDCAETGLGLLFKHMLGSSVSAGVQQGTTTAYLQQHTPGSLGTVKGMQLCFQKAVPRIPSGTIDAFTYPGSKITEWQFSCKRGEGLTLDLTIDSQQEDGTFSYTAASFSTSKIFHFGQGSVLIGGTPTTAGGHCTIAGGAAPSGVVSSVMLKGVRKMNTKRFTIGTSTKLEPLENDYIEITGELEIEYSTQADYYTASVADTQQPLEIKFTDPVAIASTFHPYIDMILPNAVFEDTPVTAQNTDVIISKVPFTVLDDLTDPIIEIDYMSTDTVP